MHVKHYDRFTHKFCSQLEGYIFSSAASLWKMSLIGEGRLAPGKLLEKRSGASFMGKLEPLSIEGQAKSNMHFTCQNEGWCGTKVMCWSPCTEDELQFTGTSGILPLLSFSVKIHIQSIHTHLYISEWHPAEFAGNHYAGASHHHRISCWNAIRLTDFTTSAIMGFILGKFVFRYTHPAVP